MLKKARKYIPAALRTETGLLARAILFCCLFLVLLLAAFPSSAQVQERLDANSAGVYTVSSSWFPSISADGRHVAFYSWGSDLVEGDTNAQADIFVKDRKTGATVRASVATDGAQADSPCEKPSLSGDGRFVAFEMKATAATKLVSDVTFVADSYHIFLRNLDQNTTTLLSKGLPGRDVGAGFSHNARVSEDGGLVVFDSWVVHQFEGEPYWKYDVYLYDGTDSLKLVSKSASGAQGNGSDQKPDITGDGRYVVFESLSTNLVSQTLDGTITQIIRHDRQTGANLLVSTSASGEVADKGCYKPRISDDGRYVVFESYAANLVSGTASDKQQLFMKDLTTGEVRRISQNAAGEPANLNCFVPTISPDGGFVTFNSAAGNLTEKSEYSTNHIYLYDVSKNSLSLVDVSPSGATANNDAFIYVDISDQGRFVVFDSEASNLVPNDPANYNNRIYLATGATATSWSIGPKGTIGGWRNDLVVAGNIAYVAEGTGVSLYDISGDTAVKRSRIAMSIEPIAIAVSGTTLYATGYFPMENDGLFVAADVANPAAPAVFGTCEVNQLKWQGSMAVNGSYVYIPTQSGTNWPYPGAVGVVDATNPAAPVTRGNLNLGDGVIADAFAVGNGKLYVQGKTTAPMFFVFNAASPLAPVKLGELAVGSNETSAGLFVDGGNVYSAVGKTGIRVVAVDAEGTPSPRHLFPVTVGATTYTARDVHVSGDLLYAACSDGGVFVYGVSDPASPVYRGLVDMEEASRVSGSGGLVAALDGHGDTAVRKIVFSGDAPTAGAGIASPLYASGGVMLDGNRLYLGAEGLFIYDASDPDNLMLLANDSRWESLVPLAVSGNALFGLTPPPGEWSPKVLSSINVADPAHPAPLDSYTASGTLKSGVVSGARAYLLLYGEGTGAEIVDIANPGALEKVGTLPFPGYSDGDQNAIAADGNLACIGGYTKDGNRVHIFDATSASNPLLKGTLNPPGRDIRLWLKGTTLLVSSNTYLTEVPVNVVEAYDLTDPAAPKRIGTISTQKGAEDMKVLSQEGQDLLIALAKPGGSVHTVGYNPSSGSFYPGPICPSPMSQQVTVSPTPNANGGYTVVTSDSSFGTYAQEITRTPTSCCLVTQISPAQAATEGCTVAPAKVDPVDCGGEVDVTATAKEPWYFKEWSGAATGTSPSAKATATARCSVAVANFVKPTLTLSAGNQNPNAWTEFYGIAGEYDYANGRTNVPIIHIVLTANEVDDWLATALTFTTSGTGNEKEDVREARLYLGAIGGTLLGTQTFSDDDANLSFTFSVNIPKSSSVSMILVYDFKPERAFPCNNYSAKLDMAHVIAIPLVYPPGQKLPAPPLGVTGGPSTIKRGDVLIDDGDRQYGQPEDQQFPNPPPLEKKLKARLKWQHPASVEHIKYEISSPTAWGGFLEGVRGQRDVQQPVNAEGYAEASMTLGTAKGHDNPYSVVVDQKNKGAACTSSYARSVFTEWGMGVELATQSQYDNPANGEDNFGTFLSNIQADNEFTLTITMAPVNFAAVEQVLFAMGGVTVNGTAVTPNQVYKGTFDMAAFEAPQQLTVTVVMLKNGERIEQQAIYPVKALKLPTWVNAVGQICDADSFTKEFSGDDGGAYTLTFNYPTNFAWSGYVPSDVGFLGGLENDLNIEFSASAKYKVDETSTFGATLKGQPKILGKEFELTGGLSGDFDPNFAFLRGTGNIGANFSFDLPEKGFSKTFLVYGVPVTAAVDLSGNVAIFVNGSAVLNRELEFEEIVVEPGTTVTGNITVSLSAVFGLAKIAATGSPSVTIKIRMKYTKANGTTTIWGGNVVVPITVVGSIFWGVGSATLCETELGPWNFGDAAFAASLARLPLATAYPASPRLVTAADLALDSAGRKMSVWIDDRTPDEAAPNPDVFFRHDGGSGWSASAPIIGDGVNTEWETDPRAVFLKDGAALACWTANKGAKTLAKLDDILAAQDIACSSWNGSVWGAPTKVIDDDRADGTAALSYFAENKALAVWVHNAALAHDARTSWKLLYAAYDAAANSGAGLFTAAADVPGTDTGKADQMPALAADGSGSAMLVWARDDDGLFYTENAKDGEGNPQVINGTTIASEENLDSHIMHALWNGTAWSAPAALATGGKATRLAPSLAPAPGGAILAVWSEKDPAAEAGKTRLIRYSVYSGGAWSTPGVVAESGQFMEEPKAAVDANKKATVIWRGYAAGGKSALFSRAGTLGTTAIAWIDEQPQQITHDDAIQWQPTITVGADNKALAAWSGYDAKTGAAQSGTGLTGGVNIAAPNPGTAALSNAYSAEAVDANGDGIYEALQASVGVSVAAAGSYTVMADLHAGNDFIVRAELTRSDLTVGAQAFVLVFPGGFISNRGLDGPYSLRNVVVLDMKDSPVQTAFAAAPGFATTAWQAAKFIPGPLSLDQSFYLGTATRAQIAVKDGLANKNAGAKDTVAVKVSTTKNPAGFAIALAETDVNTGVFAGTVGFSTKADDPTAKNILVADHDLLTALYVDSRKDRWSESALWRQTSAGIGDLNSDARVDLADLVLAMRLMARLPIPAETEVNPLGMMDPAGKITMKEAIYILQKTAGLR